MKKAKIVFIIISGMKPIAFMDGLPSCKNAFCEITTAFHS